MAVDNIARGMAADAHNGGGGGGGGGGALIVEMVWDDSINGYVLGTKAGVIFEAAKTGSVIFQEKIDGEVVNVYFLITCFIDDGLYGFSILDPSPMEFRANSADDYPNYRVG